MPPPEAWKPAAQRGESGLGDPRAPGIPCQHTTRADLTWSQPTIVGLPVNRGSTYSFLELRRCGLDRKQGKVLGRVAIDRTIRLDTRPGSKLSGSGAAGGAGGSPARDATKVGELACSRCCAVICEGTRMRLFSGIVLKCTRCGEPNPVPRLA